ncbi:MAG: hypothetical protein CM15mP54_19980 [Paracoccaceae bacterium]|nr:MAG: hypothetical protein CM15mP54_19980 [Paracoccaceae bacterium]
MTQRVWPEKQLELQCYVQPLGVASAIVMMSATEPLAQWAIMNIGPPEIFALVFLV